MDWWHDLKRESAELWQEMASPEPEPEMDFGSPSGTATSEQLADTEEAPAAEEPDAEAVELPPDSDVTDSDAPVAEPPNDPAPDLPAAPDESSADDGEDTAEYPVPAADESAAFTSVADTELPEPESPIANVPDEEYELQPPAELAQDDLPAATESEYTDLARQAAQDEPELAKLELPSLDLPEPELFPESQQGAQDIPQAFDAGVEAGLELPRESQEGDLPLPDFSQFSESDVDFAANGDLELRVTPSFGGFGGNPPGDGLSIYNVGQQQLRVQMDIPAEFETQLRDQLRQPLQEWQDNVVGMTGRAIEEQSLMSSLAAVVD